MDIQITSEYYMELIFK